MMREWSQWRRGERYQISFRSLLGVCVRGLIGVHSHGEGGYVYKVGEVLQKWFIYM